MKTIALIFLLALAGCTKPLTHEQQAAVVQACHVAGLEYSVRGSVIQCYPGTAP